MRAAVEHVYVIDACAADRRVALDDPPAHGRYLGRITVRDRPPNVFSAGVAPLRHGGGPHTLCRRSAPHALDLYQGKVARYRSPCRARQSISTIFQSNSIARLQSRRSRLRDRPQARGHSRRENFHHGMSGQSQPLSRLRAIDGNHHGMRLLSPGASPASSIARRA